MMDLSEQDELSPYVTSIRVVSPSPVLALGDLDDDDEETRYIEDHNFRIYVAQGDPSRDHPQDLSLGSPQALDSPAGSGYSSSYYSARSNFAELSPGSGPDSSSDIRDDNTVLEQHSEYLFDPAEFINPYSTSSLICPGDEESSSLFTFTSAPNSNLPVHSGEFGLQLQTQPFEPLSPLLLMSSISSNSHLNAPRGMSPSSMLDYDNGAPGMSSNIVPLTQVSSGAIALTPADSHQRIREAKHKGPNLGFSQQWHAVPDSKLSSSSASPIARESIILLQSSQGYGNRATISPSPDSSPGAQSMVVEVPALLPIPSNSCMELDTAGLPIGQSNANESNLATFNHSVGDHRSRVPFKPPAITTTVNLSSSLQSEPSAVSSPDSIIPYVSNPKLHSRDNTPTRPVLSSNNNQSSTASRLEPTHPASGAIRNGRGAKASRTSPTQHGPSPYPLEGRKVHKNPPSNLSLSSMSILTQIRRLLAKIRGVGTSSSSSHQEEPAGKFPDHLRLLASQIARIKELRKKFTQSLSNPEKRDDAQAISDYLNIILHEGDILQKDDGPKLLRLLYKVAEAAQVYPTRLLLKGVEMASQPFEGGGFADVFKGKHKDNEVCVKVIRIFESRGQAQVLKAYVREIILWSHMSHENVLPFYGLYALNESAQRICLVSPFMRNGNLRVFLQSNPKTPRLPLVLDTIEGLSYLHKLNIIHGDLKAQNILVSDDGRALITDFGLSFIAITTTTGATDPEAAGTMNWMAPELIDTANLSAKPTKESDIWSFGCICYEIYTGNYPFHQYKNRGQVLLALLRGEIPARPTSEDVVCDYIEDWMWDPIMSGCWKTNPQDRLQCRVIRDILLSNVMQDTRSKTCHWDEQKSAFWQEMKDRSDNQVDCGRVEETLISFLKTHEKSNRASSLES